MAENLDRARVLGELSVEAAGVGTFDWDLLTGVLTWDERLMEQFGYDRETFTPSITSFDARVHPEDLPRVHRLLQDCIDTCGEYAAEYRVVHPDGSMRWLSAKGRALGPPEGAEGPARRVLGATLDVTATRTSEAAVAVVLEAMNAAYFAIDAGWRFSYVNTEAELLLGSAREHLVGEEVWPHLPEAGVDGTDFGARLREAAATGGVVAFDVHQGPALEGTWYEVRARATADGLAVYFLDITARKQAQQRAERAVRRAALVARVTSELAEHLEAEIAVARLARLVVPVLADWCLVSLVDDTSAAGARNSLRDVGWWHVDPQMREVVRQYASVRRDLLDRHAFVLRAIEENRPVVVETDAAATLGEVLGSAEAVELIDRLDPDSTAILPLTARGRTVGLLSLFSSRERGPLTPEEFQTCLEVAGRAGLALDNSRLYRQQLHLAEGLQRSLLTPPPAPDRVEVAVRYTPAGEAAQVGGDWYDAFVQPGGSTVLVIGDVVGHDAQAAAAMGQLRTLVRGVGAVDDDGPAEILRKVDQLLRTLRVDTTATGVVARVEGEAEDLRLRWSNAGHLPPMAVASDGRVTRLDAESPDLLLGVLPRTARHETTAALDPGTVVLFYTDGLVERRHRPLESGMQLLRDHLADLAGSSPEHVCDEVLRRMLPEHPEDDVALVAVRRHEPLPDEPPR